MSKNYGYEVGKLIQLKTNDNWDNLYGIIDNIIDGVIYVFCIQFPGCRYQIYKDNMDCIKLANF